MRKRQVIHSENMQLLIQERNNDSFSQSGGSFNTYKSIDNNNNNHHINYNHNNSSSHNNRIVHHNHHHFKNKYSNSRNTIHHRRNNNTNNEIDHKLSSITTKNRSNFINKPANIAPPTYQIGDQVDGLCTLQNGSKRWYPGVIIAMNMNTSNFSLQFNDGEISYTMTAATMRPRKNRRRKRGGGGASRTDRSSFGGDSIDDMSLMSSNDEISIISSLDNLSLTGSISGVYHDFSDQVINLYGDKANHMHHITKDINSGGGDHKPPPTVTEIVYTQKNNDDVDDEDKAAVADDDDLLLTNRSLGNSTLDESVNDNKDVSKLNNNNNTNDIDEIVMESAPAANSPLASSLSRTHMLLLLSTNKPGSGSNKTRAFESPEKSDTNENNSLDFILSPSPFSNRNALEASNNKEIHASSRMHRNDHEIDLANLLSSTADDNISVSLSVHSLKSNNDKYENHIQETQNIENNPSNNNNNEDDSSCGSSAEKDLIFEIPSIFDGVATHRTTNNLMTSFRNAVALVPRMRFDDLDMSSALPNNASNFSLSGALLNENTSRSFRQNTSQRSIADVSISDSMNNSHLYYHHNQGSSNKLLIDDPSHTSFSRHSTGPQQLWQQGSFNDDQSSQYSYSDKNILQHQYSSNPDSFPSYMIEKDPFHDWLYSIEDSNVYLQSMFQTYCFISVILLKQCITSKGLLDSIYCTSPGEIFSPMSLESSEQQQYNTNTTIAGEPYSYGGPLTSGKTTTGTFIIYSSI